MASGTANPEPTGIGRGVREDQSQQIANPQITQIIFGIQARTQIDPRLAFLARAAARCFLVEAGEMEIDEAFDGLVPAFCSIFSAEESA